MKKLSLDSNTTLDEDVRSIVEKLNELIDHLNNQTWDITEPVEIPKGVQGHECVCGNVIICSENGVKVELPKEICRNNKCVSNNPFILGDCDCRNGEPKETSLRDGENMKKDIKDFLEYSRKRIEGILKLSDT